MKHIVRSLVFCFALVLSCTSAWADSFSETKQMFEGAGANRYVQDRSRLCPVPDHWQGASCSVVPMVKAASFEQGGYWR